MRLSEEEYQALLKRGHVREVGGDRIRSRTDESTMKRDGSVHPRPALLPPGAAMGAQLPLRLSNAKSSHQHWSKRRQRVQFERQYVYDRLTMLWEDGPLLGLPLTIVLTRIAPRALDDDNLRFACSAVRDAVSDWLAGTYLKGDDRQIGLDWTYEQRCLCPHFYAVEIRGERPKKTNKVTK